MRSDMNALWAHEQLVKSHGAKAAGALDDLGRAMVALDFVKATAVCTQLQLSAQRWNFVKENSGAAGHR
jgi:hypothetical protein